MRGGAEQRGGGRKDGSGADGTPGAGEPFTAELDRAYPGRVVSARAGHYFAGVLPDLDRSVFFVEIEGPHVGFWLSTYGFGPDRLTPLQRALDARVEQVVG